MTLRPRSIMPSLVKQQTPQGSVSSSAAYPVRQQIQCGGVRSFIAALGSVRQHGSAECTPRPNHSAGLSLLLTLMLRLISDKLENVLPHVTVSDGPQRLLGEAVEMMDQSALVAKSTSLERDAPMVPLAPSSARDQVTKSAPPTIGSPAAKPSSPTSSTSTNEVDKKGPSDEVDAGVVSKKPK